MASSKKKSKKVEKKVGKGKAEKKAKTPAKKIKAAKKAKVVAPATKKNVQVKSNAKKVTGKNSGVKINTKIGAPKVASKVSSSKKQNITFKPLYEHILIMQDGESDRTPGGLYIPAIAQDRPARGRVLAVGSGRKNKKGQTSPLDVKTGESVLYNRYAGSKIKIDGDEYLILKESDVLGVVRD